MADYSDYKECTDCVHYELCLHQEKFLIEHNRKDLIRRYGFGLSEPENCCNFRDRSRFVELNIAKKIKHAPDIDKMKEFHKLGLGNGMGERSIFWTCSNCELWVSLAHKFCPNCGAKFEAEHDFKERGSNAE